jgi:hypothetical protein
LAEHPAAPTNPTISSQLNWVLAEQWTHPHRIDGMLKVFKLLTSSPNQLVAAAKDPNQQALDKLVRLDPDHGDKSLFEAAMGNPDAHGHPTVAPPFKFLDVLSKATLLTPGKDDAKVLYDYDLSACTKSLVNSLYLADNGAARPEIVNIDATFQNGGQASYAGLYQLLLVYHQHFEIGADALKDLEILRAEFAESPGDLAKIIHAKVSATQD